MNLSSFIRTLFEKSEFKTPASLANYINENNEVKVTESFVRDFIERTKDTRKKEDVIFETLTKNIAINLHGVSGERSYQITDEEDKKYYFERAKDIVRKGDFDYLTTNEILHSMRDFVQTHQKLENEVSVRCEDDYVILYTLN